MLPAPPENSRVAAIAASPQPVSWTPPEEGRTWPENREAIALTISPILRPRLGSASVDGIANAVLLVQLDTDLLPKP
jgi:hypothetical protein